MTVVAPLEYASEMLASQEHIARIDELESLGLSRQQITAEVRANRWQRLGQTVIAAHNAPLTQLQRDWAAVLSAGRTAALCGRSAARHFGLSGWDDGLIHVIVEHGSSPAAVPLPVKVHESRRYGPDDRHPLATPPMTTVERSVIDAAAWTSEARAACGFMVAAVQQGLATPARLQREIDTIGHVQHNQLLRTVLSDVAGDSNALAKVDVVRFCRRHGLPEPLRQLTRAGAAGERRYVSAEFRSERGTRWMLEVDGAAQLIIGGYWTDPSLNSITVEGDSLVRVPAVTFYTDEAAVAVELHRLLHDRP